VISAVRDQSIGVDADASRPDDLQRLVDAAVAKFGRLDVMVNNAGVETRTSVLDTTEAQYDWVLCLSKGGMRMLTLTAGVELAPRGINVVGVGPGTVATPINLSTMNDPALGRERIPSWFRPDRRDSRVRQLFRADRWQESAKAVVTGMSSTGGVKLSTPPERDGRIDEGADARRGLRRAERDGKLDLLSKVRERPECDLRETQSAHGLRPQHHAVAAGGHAERRHEIADVMDDLDREPASCRQPLQVASEAGAFRDLGDDESLVAQVRRLQGAAARKRMIGGERHAKGFAMNHLGRHPRRVAGPRPYQGLISSMPELKTIPGT
jgi:Enoyl-(Acyl carrier protein) reductase